MPTDTTADGGGITLRGTTNKTLNWVDSTDSWTSSENVDLASGKTYKINGTNVLSSDTLGPNIVNSSLTSVGTLTSLNVTGSLSIPNNSIAASKLASYPKLIVPHTFVIGGPVNVQSGQIDYINPFFVRVPSTQTVKLISARHRINSGTSVTCKLQNNGVDIAGFTGMSVITTAADTDPADVTLANNDLISLVVTATTGSPQNMSMTVFLEYTWVG